MSIQRAGLFAAMLTVLSSGVHAAGFSYNYGQVGYELGDYDGLVLTGSFDVNKDFFILARYVGVSEERAGFDFDYSEASIGAGYHMPIAAGTDAVFTLSIVSNEIDVVIPPGVTVGSADDTGVLATAGVRHNISPKLEVAGHVFHITNFDGDTGIQGEIRYNIDNRMSAGLNFTSSDVVDGLGVNFRYNF